jgi:hypothetical protein
MAADEAEGPGNVTVLLLHPDEQKPEKQTPAVGGCAAIRRGESMAVIQDT